MLAFVHIIGFVYELNIILFFYYFVFVYVVQYSIRNNKVKLKVYIAMHQKQAKVCLTIAA